MRKWIFALHRDRRGARGLQEHRHAECRAGRGQIGHRGHRRRRASTTGAWADRASPAPPGRDACRTRIPSNILSQKRSIYFDYDQFVIKDEYRATVEAHAKYLQGNRTLRMTLQGNTDERGTREYNIALGQKRADAVKKLMVLLGAHRGPDRDGELRQGKAAARRPRRELVGRESPRRYRLCWRIEQAE